MYIDPKYYKVGKNMYNISKERRSIIEKIISILEARYCLAQALMSPSDSSVSYVWLL